MRAATAGSVTNPTLRASPRQRAHPWTGHNDAFLVSGPVYRRVLAAFFATVASRAGARR
jgi:hypothetical protein